MHVRLNSENTDKMMAAAYKLDRSVGSLVNEIVASLEIMQIETVLLVKDSNGKLKELAKMKRQAKWEVRI